MKEKYVRSIIKTVSWRVIASTITISLVFWVTGKLTLSLGVGLVEAVIKMLVYYLHERGWDKVGWGRKKEPCVSILDD